MQNLFGSSAVMSPSAKGFTNNQQRLQAYREVINRRGIVSTESDPLSLILSPNPGGEGRVRGVLASIETCDP